MSADQIYILLFSLIIITTVVSFSFFSFFKWNIFKKRKDVNKKEEKENREIVDSIEEMDSWDNQEIDNENDEPITDTILLGSQLNDEKEDVDNLHNILHETKTNEEDE